MTTNKRKLVWCSTFVLLGAAVFASCSKPPAAVTSDPKSDPKSELANSLKGVDVSGFEFSTREDDAIGFAAFTNRAVRDLITLEKGTNNVVLQYARIKDKKANTTKTYKTEVVRKDTRISVRVTDFDTNAVISDDDTEPPPPPPRGGDFNTLEECLADFNCKHRGEVQCAANRTCKTQIVGIMCCLTNGQCISVHLVIKPNSLKCSLLEIGQVPDLEGIVLRP